VVESADVAGLILGEELAFGREGMAIRKLGTPEALVGDGMVNSVDIFDVDRFGRRWLIKVMASSALSVGERMAKYVMDLVDFILKGRRIYSEYKRESWCCAWSVLLLRTHYGGWQYNTGHKEMQITNEKGLKGFM
jgi:hypothetical protein